jgi:hypothetical protein
VTSLDHALSLWRRGFSIFPVPQPDSRHDGKRPAIAWRQFQAERATESELRSMFAAPSNIAIVCGRISGVVVVDADGDAPARWWVGCRPYTPWQSRTARGWHLFYRHPDVDVPNRAGIHTPSGRLSLDVRGDGGYVIAPGSVHATGTLYEEAGDWQAPIATIPPFDLRWLERPQAAESLKPRRSSSTPSTRADLIERARRYLAAIPQPQIGAGSDAATLYAACRLVRGFGLAPADAEQLLWEWAGGRPGWTRAWINRKIAHGERYGTEAIGSLA